MRTGTAHNGSVELHWVGEGAVDAPTVVLVNGAGSTSVTWCRELIDPLLDAGHQVVRFDNRDVGRSTRLPPTAPYTVADMAADLVAVLDATTTDAAHVVGRSLGGAIALTAALDHADRVASLGLIYTSPCMAQAREHGLPGPQRRILEHMEEQAFAPPPASDDERVERAVAVSRVFAGDRYPFDERWARAEAEADAAHAPFAEPGHGVAVMASPSLVPRLGEIAQPALVLHGTADPIIDITHGRLLADRLRNATLLELDGLGHEMPPAFCAEIVPPLLDLFAAATDQL